MQTDARNPQHWFDIAEEDLIRAHRRFVERDFKDCIFRLQQSAEKAMKGKLIALGWPLQKTHDLAVLSVALQSYQVDCGWFEETADVLATEYIADRYPGFDDAPPDAVELRGFIEDTTKLFACLTGRKYTGPPLPTQDT
jgi:HEPN domain-containing protein